MTDPKQQQVRAAHTSQVLCTVNLMSEATCQQESTATTFLTETLDEDCRKHNSVINAEILWTKVVLLNYFYIAPVHSFCNCLKTCFRTVKMRGDSPALRKNAPTSRATVCAHFSLHKYDKLWKSHSIL